MARTKSKRAKTEDTELFVGMYPQCADAVNVLQAFKFGPEHAHAILNAQEGKEIAAPGIRERFGRLSEQEKDKVIGASATVTEHWPEFLHEKNLMDRELQGLDDALPEGWTLDNTAPKEKSDRQTSSQSSTDASSRMPTAGQAATAVAGLAAAGGAAVSWRDRAQQRSAPTQDAAKGQGKIARTLAFAAGAVVLLGAAAYAYSRSQGQGAARG